MAKIKIKCRQNNREQKLKLLEILCTRDIEVSGFIPTYDGFVVLPINEHHADSIFNAEVKEQLEAHGFRPSLPPELKVKKSIILTRVEDIIYEKHILDIGEEIVKHNTWLDENSITDVYKFPNSPTIKITFTQTNLAQKCIGSGLKAFGISIPPHMIKQETYIPVKCCMRCYTLEHHFTSECPKQKEYKICSECSQEGHVWHQCESDVKKCLNCGEPHSTMAMKCKKRKEIIKGKRTEINEKQKMSYSSVITPSATASINSNFLPPIITKEEILKIHICAAHAQNQEQKKPGSYNYEFNRILKINNLPTIIIPPEEPEQTPNNTQTQDEGAMAVAIADTDPETQIKTSKITKTKSTESLSGKVIDAEEIGLEFYTTKERGWPKNFSCEDLISGIQTKKYKAKYTDKKYTEDQILKKTRRGEINLATSNCWFAVDNEEFKKIRPGINLDRSPPTSKDPRKIKPYPRSYLV